MRPPQAGARPVGDCRAPAQFPHRLGGDGIEQAMDVHNKVAHMRIVDGLLGRGPPSLIGLGVARVDADDVEPIEVFEFHVRQVLELAAKDEMEQLLCWSCGADRRGHSGLLGKSRVALRRPSYRIMLADRVDANVKLTLLLKRFGSLLWEAEEAGCARRPARGLTGKGGWRGVRRLSAANAALRFQGRVFISRSKTRPRHTIQPIS